MNYKEKDKKCELRETTNMDSGHFETIYYKPSCKYKHNDCILDPAYIKATYPNWYKELNADGGCNCNSCINCSDYDDEDK